MKNVLKTSLATLITLTAFASTSVFAQEGLQAMRAFVAAQKAVSGDFVQTMQGKTTRQSGTFAMSRPGHFRWAISKPFEQLIVSDGKTMTQWDADLNQATVRSAVGILNNTPAMLLLGGAEVEKQFGLVDAGSEDGLVWAQATPKQAESQFKTFMLGFKDGQPAALRIEDAFGGVSKIELKNVQTKAVPDSQFNFTPPKGADVVKL